MIMTLLIATVIALALLNLVTILDHEDGYWPYDASDKTYEKDIHHGF